MTIIFNAETKNVTPDMVFFLLLQTAFFWLIYIPHNSAHKLHSKMQPNRGHPLSNYRNDTESKRSSLNHKKHAII